MDLLQTVRKEGSRGGRANFSWQDVQNDAHRQNYLGHSLMAPVGRWQKGKDLNWYAKGDGDGDGLTEEELRKEEMRKIKEREEDEMLRAMGMPVPDRENANLEPVKERAGRTVGVSDEAAPGKSSTGPEDSRVKGPIMERKRSRSRSREHRHRRNDRSRSRERHHRRDDRRRSRSRDEDRERRHRSRREDDDRERRHRHKHRDHRSRSRSGDRRRHRSRSPDGRRNRDRDRRRHG